MRLLFIIVVLITLGACAPEDGPVCKDSNCEDYASQAAAQRDFENDPDCHGDLDRDNDGKACEHFFRDSDPDINPDPDPDPPTGCPTTSNCGCSNKRKDECASDCCKWVVGEGCKCK